MSDQEIIVAGDDGELVTDGGSPPNLTGGTTGASEESDIQVDEKPAYFLKTDPMPEHRAKALRERIIQMAGVDPERIKLRTTSVEVDSR